MTALDERIAKYPQKILAVDNVDISYREAGQGIPVVLLHGIGSGSGSWLFQLESLQQNYHLIAWDAPGYGQSSPLTKEIPEALDYADTLKRLVDALRLKTFYLIGHSFGALIAAAYCHQFSASVSSLVLVDPAMGYGKNRPEERDRKNHARIELMQSLGPGGWHRKEGENSFLLRPQKQLSAWCGGICLACIKRVIYRQSICWQIQIYVSSVRALINRF